MAQQVRVRVRVRVRARVRARVRVAEWSIRGASPLLPVRVKANLSEIQARRGRDIGEIDGRYREMHARYGEIQGRYRGDARTGENLTEPTARPTTHLPASGHGSSSRAETPTSAATAAANTVPRQRWIPLFVVEPTWLGFE